MPIRMSGIYRRSGGRLMSVWRGARPADGALSRARLSDRFRQFCGGVRRRRSRMRNLERAWTSMAVFGKFTEHQQEALMARAASKKSSKKRGAASRKTGRGSARKGPAAKKGAPQKRSASKGRRRQTKGSAEWAGAFQTLLGSSQGREIMADMLDAVSATLRKQRETAIRAGEAGTEAVAGAVETTLDAATEIASGTMGIAQRAATVLTDVISEAMRSVLAGLPGGTTGSTKTRGRQRSPRK